MGTLVEPTPALLLGMRCESCSRVTRDLVWVYFGHPEFPHEPDDAYLVCAGCAPEQRQLEFAVA